MEFIPRKPFSPLLTHSALSSKVGIQERQIQSCSFYFSKIRILLQLCVFHIPSNNSSNTKVNNGGHGSRGINSTLPTKNKRTVNEDVFWEWISSKYFISNWYHKYALLMCILGQRSFGTLSSSARRSLKYDKEPERKRSPLTASHSLGNLTSSRPKLKTQKSQPARKPWK